MFGYPVNEILGKNISLMFPEGSYKEEYRYIEKLSKGDRVVPYATHLRTKDKGLAAVVLSLSPIYGENDKITGVGYIAHDSKMPAINERDTAMLASIISSSDDAIISKNLNGVITSWNHSAEKIFGYTAEEAVGQHIFLIIPEDHRAEEQYIISEIKAGRRVEHFETIRRTKDGSLIPLSITVSPIKDKSGNLIGASKIARTLSQQRKSEEKQAMLASIVESSGDAIISKTINGIVTSWNPAAEKILGFSEKEMIGKSILTIIPDNRKEEEKHIIERIQKGERLDHFETVRKKKNGELISVSITVSPIINKGKIVGVSKILRDISDRIEIERRLASQAKRLEELIKSKDEFIGIASHELKTPLTSIKAYLQLLERITKDVSQHGYVEKTLDYVIKLERLVSDLLDVSKVRAGKFHMDFVPYSLQTVIDRAIESVQLTSRTHTISQEGQSDLMVICDHNRLEQVLVNLLTNAIKYSPQGNSVLVKTMIKGDEVIVSVHDKGIGIEKDELQNIFQRFYRAEGLAPKFSGLGIGLYISNEIIDRHDGRIWAESEIGKGSVFSFALPLAN